ncbi:hypothetical protein [Streptomyces goshikiensis]
MLGKKSQKIRNLERLVRMLAADLDRAHTDYRALHADMRDVAVINYTDATTMADRLARALRACSRYRAELGQQQRVVHRLSSSLLDSVGNKGEHLLPSERAALGISDTEVAR